VVQGAEVEPDGTITFAGSIPWTVDGQWRHTRIHIGEEGCIEGTDRPLTGVLFAYLDVVMGSPPSGILNPTVDLQLKLFAVPKRGLVHFRARTLRLGRTFYVGEAEMRHDPGEEPFGIGVSTFMNQPIPFPDRTFPREHSSNGGPATGPVFGRHLGARRLGPGRFELDATNDTPQGTVPGTTLGRLAELAVTDLLTTSRDANPDLGPAPGRNITTEELDVRFLNKVKVGPIRTESQVVGRRGDTTTVRVEVTDAGNEDRLVTHALALCRDTSTA
jgi:acyl-coenzyme A thioesterase PaaI-like protein